MPFIKVYIHIVFATKNRIPYLDTSALRVKVWKHIKENASEKRIFVDVVNGYSDHCHCLISLGSDQNIGKVIQLLKGESSFWINKTNLQKINLPGRKSILLFPFRNQWLIRYGIILYIRKSIIKRKHLLKNVRNF